MKTCKSCHRKLSKTMFYRTHARCKTCVLKLQKQYYQKNKAVVLERNKKYISTHPDIKKKAQRKYTETHKIRLQPIFRQHAKKYYHAHKEYYAKKAKKYYLNNRDKCIEIANESKKRILQKYPWYRHWIGTRSRCNWKNNQDYHRYGGRGIKALITLDEVGILWNRDKAYLMKRPSIDRINNDGNYELNNCQFLEMSEHGKKTMKEIIMERTQ